MNTRRRFLAAALATPVALAGCKVRTINYFPGSTAHVRFVNAMVGSAAIDLVEGDTVLFAAIPFEGSTGFTDLENTPRKFRIRFTGQTTDLGSIDLALAGEQSYTIVAFGTAERPELLVAPDVMTSGSGQVQIRIINVAVGSPSYDVFITDPDVVFDNNLSPNLIGIQGGSSTTSLRFEQRALRIRATPNGSSSLAFDSGPLDFTVSSSVDLVLYTLGSQGLPAMMLLDVDGALRRQLVPSAIAAMRMVNAAFQSGAIIGKFDGTVFTAEIPYPGVTGYGFQAAGLHTVSFEAVATPGATIASLQYDFPRSLDTSLVAVGTAGAVQILAFPDDNRVPGPGTMRIRFVNASSDNGAYDAYLGDTKLVSALAARTASPYFTQLEGTYTVTFRDPGTGTTVLTVADLALGEGRVTTIYVTGVAGNLNSQQSTER
ncbi:MAG: DUF4397 domain-containing protein [Betaproteobacteria bacterium]